VLQRLDKPEHHHNEQQCAEHRKQVSHASSVRRWRVAMASTDRRARQYRVNGEGTGPLTLVNSVARAHAVPMTKRSRAALAVSLVAPLVIALAMVPFRDHLANAAAALVLVAAVVAVAAFGDRRAGLIATISASAWFDFFLTRPYEKFSISSAHDIETALALIVVGVAVTEMAVRSHRMFQIAMREGVYLAAIRELSDLVSNGAPVDTVISEATRELSDVLGALACRFEPDGSAALPAGRPRLERNGEVEQGDVRFDVATDGMPAGEIELLVQGRGRPCGRFVFTSESRRPVSIEQRIAAIALADQVGAALVGHTEPA
jgi:K+-sensing histidine kinase KdpD